MLLALRHVAAFLALPFVMAGVIPYFIVRRTHAALAMQWPLLAVAALLAIAGATLFITSLYEFGTRGRGTLAPWDPPRKLVVHGPYRYVRNPMITGVVLLIATEAALFASQSVGEWALLFAAINAIYIPLLEEPMLAERFGADYEEYCKNVPRLIPRMTPWTPAS